MELRTCGIDSELEKKEKGTVLCFFLINQMMFLRLICLCGTSAETSALFLSS